MHVYLVVCRVQLQSSKYILEVVLDLEKTVANLMHGLHHTFHIS